MMPQGSFDPAFPVYVEAHDGKPIGVCGGLSILDYFAAAALQGLLSRHSSDEPSDGLPRFTAHYPCGDSSSRKLLADRAYEVAKAMIDARVENYLDQADAEA